MKHPLPASLTPVEDVPVEFIESKAGLYFRSILLKLPGMVVPQHVHDHDHATYIGSGMARAWVDGEWIGDFRAGQAVEVLAGKQHVFQSLMSNTRLACVHDEASAESAKRRGG